jgi:hypothetical protein
MSNIEFEDLLSIIVTNTVSIIAKNNNWDNDYALNRFLSSNVYSTLEKEETKVWHLSSYMLAKLFEDEREGYLVWPEVM